MKCTARLVFRAALIGLGILSLATVPATAQTATTLKGVYVMSEEGDSMHGAFARLALVTFSESGAVSGTEVFRNAAGVKTSPFQGSLVLETPTMGMLHLRYETPDGEDNIQIQENAYMVVIGQTTIQAIRTTLGGHSTVTLAKAADSNPTGMFLFAEAERGKPDCRIVVLTLDRSGIATGNIYNAHPIGRSTAVSGSIENTENGFRTLSLSSQGEDAEGNVVITTEKYVVAFENGSIAVLRTNGGALAVRHLMR